MLTYDCLSVRTLLVADGFPFILEGLVTFWLMAVEVNFLVDYLVVEGYFTSFSGL
jgi:hypothetical protein